MLLQETADFTLVGSYAHCLDVTNNIRDTKPDVVIMDIDMPGMNGIEGVKVIRKNFPTVQVLMLTVFDDDEKVFAAIKAGAGGYILKNAEPQNLAACYFGSIQRWRPDDAGHRKKSIAPVSRYVA